MFQKLKIINLFLTKKLIICRMLNEKYLFTIYIYLFLSRFYELHLNVGCSRWFIQNCFFDLFSVLIYFMNTSNIWLFV